MGCCSRIASSRSAPISSSTNRASCAGATSRRSSGTGVTMSSCSGRSPRSERRRPMKHAVLLGVMLAGACGPTVFIPPPPSPQRVYGIAEVDERPEIVLTPPLRFPPGGSDGVVVVRLVIDSAGNPEPATTQIVQGSDSALVAAARTLVLKTLFRAARFTAGRIGGRAVRVRFEMPVEFKLPTRD